MAEGDAEVLDLEAQYSRASEYLKRFEKKLFLAIERLESDDAIGSTVKDVEQIVAKLEKVAFKLFEIGYKLDELHRKHQPPAGVLDLDAARAEILGRLACDQEEEEPPQSA